MTEELDDKGLFLNYRLGESYVIGGMAAGKVRLILSEALHRQRRGRSFWLVVPDLETLDYCVARGIKPSNIKVTSEWGEPSGRAWTFPIALTSGMIKQIERVIDGLEEDTRG